MESENQALESPNKKNPILPETPEAPVTINYRPRNVDMFYVFDQELESIGSANIESSLHFALFGAAFGAMLCLWVTIATVEIKSPNGYGAFWAVALLSTILTLYFGVKSKHDYTVAKERVKAIKEASPERKKQAQD